MSSRREGVASKRLTSSIVKKQRCESFGFGRSILFIFFKGLRLIKSSRTAAFKRVTNFL
jgi:hypothetical protein